MSQVGETSRNRIEAIQRSGIQDSIEFRESGCVDSGIQDFGFRVFVLMKVGRKSMRPVTRGKPFNKTGIQRSVFRIFALI